MPSSNGMPLQSAGPSVSRGPLVDDAAVGTTGWPLLRLGFRPFYLLASAGAGLLPLLWVALLSGLANGGPALSGVAWHAHEMLFGVVVATVVGFLFTAGRTWTGLPTPRGGFLGAMALLWLAARITAWTGPYALFALLDLVFLPLAAAVFIALLVRARNRRNAPLGAALLFLTALNATFHGAQLALLPLDAGRVLQSALLGLVAVASLVAGRVIPHFTANAVAFSRPRQVPRLERALGVGTLLALVAWPLAPQVPATGMLLGTLALLHAVRAALWQPWLARRLPILAVLHAAYAALPLGFTLLAASAWGVVPASAGLHLLATGALGGLMVGMMSRTSRGHTGRPLHAGRRERWAYGLVLGGAVLRVAAALPWQGAAGSARPSLLVGAAFLWCGGFALLFTVLLPWLLRPRLDGRPG